MERPKFSKNHKTSKQCRYKPETGERLNFVRRDSLLFETNKSKSSKKVKKEPVYPESIMKALTNIKYLNNRMKKDNLDLEIIEDWKFVSMVVDRMLLLVFGVTFFVGTVGILMQAPSIYDKRDAITRFNFKKIK
jgi:hypothetical protein